MGQVDELGTIIDQTRDGRNETTTGYDTLGVT
jgi:hypothetical protein